MVKRSIVQILLLTILLVIPTITVKAWEIDQTSQVTRFIDGDSFYITNDQVRLADVNAPEYNQPGGTQATNAIKNLLSGKTLYLDTDQKSGRDPYNRLVAVVYVVYNSTHYLNVNKELLLEGVVALDDFSNNEFSPSTWTRYVRYASNPPPPTSYALTIQAPEGSGSTSPITGVTSVAAGDSIQIIATPSSGWSFDHWVLDGGISGTSLTKTLTMNSDHIIKAVFVQNNNPPTPPPPPPPEPTPTFCSLTIAVKGSGTTSPAPGNYSYEKGTILKIEQTPSTFWQFSHWLINNTSHTENILNVTLTQNLNIVAIFTEQPPCGVTFKVTDSNQAPLVGALIETNLQVLSGGNVSLWINDQGVGSLNFLRAGHYTFKATKSGYQPEMWEVTLAPGEYVEHIFALEVLPVDIRLVLVGLNGDPLPDVLVASIEEPTGQAKVSGVTASNGILILKGVKPGGYEFEVSGIWIKKQVWPITVNLGKNPQFYNTSIQSYGWLRLKVADEQGKPMIGVVVQSIITPSGQNAIDLFCNGELVLTDLIDGVYQFKFSKDGYQNADYLVNFRAGSLNEVGTVVLVKTWTNILSENILLIFIALVLVCSVGFVLLKELKRPSFNDLAPAINETVSKPSYFGTTEGLIIKAIVIDGLHEFSDIQQNVGISKDEFMKSVYTLLKADVLIGSKKDTFDVNEKIRSEWRHYYKLES